VPGTGREATEARKCLLASQKEVQRLQRALRSEQDAARSLSAQLSDAEEARVRLERQVLDLEALLDAQTKRADEAAEALIVQQGAITDTQLQEFADEMEEIQEKLAASERNNLQLQSEWEHLQQELREENEKLKGQLAGSQRTREDADAKWDESARGLRQEVEELKQSLESAQAALDEAEASRQSQVQALQCKVAELEEYGRELEAVAEEEVEDLKAKVAELQEANERLAQEAAASRDAAAALGRQSSRDTLSTASPEAAVQASSSVQVNMEMLVGILDGPRRRVRRVMGQWMREALRGSIARGCRAPLLAASSLGAEEEDSGEQRAAGSAPQPRALHHATNLAVGSALNCSVSEGVQIGGGECISEGVQTNGGSECVSEGVQTMSVVGETKAAQTAQAAGAATHTQTPLSQSVAAAAQTVAPEPGVVVHTQTTAAATTTTATGTADEDEAGAGAMDLVQVAPGPAPAPREVSQMEW
jgi:predicted  nucleic acid-binding Zn-ribbon protein